MYQIHEDVYCMTVASLWEDGDTKEEHAEQTTSIV